MRERYLECSGRDRDRWAMFGAHETERVRAREVTYTLNGLSIAACLWGLYAPSPYGLSVLLLALLPLVGGVAMLAVASRRAWHPKRTLLYSALLPSVLLPSAALVVRASLDVYALDSVTLIAVAAAMGLALAALGASLGGVRRHLDLAVMAVVAGLYLWSTGLLANALLDGGRAEVFQVAVDGKHVSRGRNATTWMLDLAPWGPISDGESVSVPRPLYDAVAVGQRVCAGLRPGALGLRWYEVRRCAD